MEQPQLPAGIPWPDVTTKWWAEVGESPEAAAWTSLQWLSMLDTALCHADVWGGNLDRLPELRTRLADFGFTPAKGGALPASGSVASTVDEFTKRREERKAK